MATTRIRGEEEVLAFAEAHTAGRDGTLAPCRACGRWPEVVDRGVNGAGPYRVECPSCGIRTGESTCFPTVLAAWNGAMR